MEEINTNINLLKLTNTTREGSKPSFPLTSLEITIEHTDEQKKIVERLPNSDDINSKIKILSSISKINDEVLFLKNIEYIFFSKLKKKYEKNFKQFLRGTRKLFSKGNVEAVNLTDIALLQEVEHNLRDIQASLEKKISKIRTSIPELTFFSCEKILEIFKHSDQKQQITSLLSMVLIQFKEAKFGEDGGLKITGIDFKHNSMDFETPIAVTTDFDTLVQGVKTEVGKWLRNSLNEVYINEGNVDYEKIPAQIIALYYDIEFTQDLSAKSQEEHLQKIETRIKAHINFLRENIPVWKSLIYRGLLLNDLNRKYLLISQSPTLHFTYNAGEGEVTITAVRGSKSQVHYGFHYIGVNNQLVMTPLTNRIYTSVVSSLQIGRGSILYGKAGTGKTETTKDLSNRLGYGNVVYNVSQDFGVESMKNAILGGLRSGRWVIFDEFNRTPSGDQLKEFVQGDLRRLQRALHSQEESVEFGGQEVEINERTLNPAFFTFNPGYFNRGYYKIFGEFSECFNKIELNTPDLTVLIGAILAGKGFIKYEQISGIIVKVFDFCKKYLSKQKFYDFGLRNIFRMTNSLKPHAALAEDQDLPEEFYKEVFTRISVSLTEQDKQLLKKYIEVIGNLIVENSFITRVNEINETHQVSDVNLSLKVAQFSSFLDLQTGFMLVGNDSESKKKFFETALKANGDNVKLTTIELGGKSLEELYGKMKDDSTFEEGEITKAIRNQNSTDKNSWILIKGNLTCHEAEYLNTVLDGNRTLCLMNGERIPVNETTKLIFDNENVDMLTLATISRILVIPFMTQEGEPEMVEQMEEIEVDIKTQITEKLTTLSEENLLNKNVENMADLIEDSYKTINQETPISLEKFLEIYSSILKNQQTGPIIHGERLARISEIHKRIQEIKDELDYQNVTALRNMKKRDISFISSLSKPPLAIFGVCSLLTFILTNKKSTQNWKGASSEMRNGEFIYKLLQFNPFKMKVGLINRVKKIVQNNQQIIDTDYVMKSSKAAGGFSEFIKWIYEAADSLIESSRLYHELEEIRTEIIHEGNDEVVIEDEEEIFEDGIELSREEKSDIFKNVIESKLEEFETLKEDFKSLDPSSIAEMRSFAKPPTLAKDIFQAVVLIRYGKLKKAWGETKIIMKKFEKEKLADFDLSSQSRKKIMKIKQMVEKNQDLINEAKVKNVSLACSTLCTLIKFFYDIGFKITVEEEVLIAKKRAEENPEDQMEEIEEDNPQTEQENDKKILEEIYQRRKEEFDEVKGNINDGLKANMKARFKSKSSFKPIITDIYRVYFYITSKHIFKTEKGLRIKCSKNREFKRFHPKDPTDLNRNQYKILNELIQLNPKILTEIGSLLGIAMEAPELANYIKIMNEFGQELLNKGNREKDENSDIKALIATDYAVRYILENEEIEPKSIEGISVEKEELSKYVTGGNKYLISKLENNSSHTTSIGENLGDVGAGLKQFESKFNENDFAEATRYYQKFLHLAKTFNVFIQKTVESTLSSTFNDLEGKIEIENFKLKFLNSFINQFLSNRTLEVLIFYNAVIQNELESTQGTPETMEEAVNRVKTHLKLEGNESTQTALLNWLSSKRTPVKFTVLKYYQLLDESELESMPETKSRFMYLALLTDAVMKNLNLTTDDGKWKLVLDFVNTANFDGNETVIKDLTNLIETYYANEHIDEGNQEKIRTLVGKLFGETSFDEKTVQVEGFNLPQTGFTHMNAIESLPDDAGISDLMASTSSHNIFTQGDKHFQIPRNDTIQILKFLEKGFSILDSLRACWNENQKELEDLKTKISNLEEKASGQGQGSKKVSLNLDLWRAFHQDFQKAFGGSLSISDIEKKRLRKQFGECRFFSLKKFFEESVKMIEELGNLDVDAKVESGDVICLRA